MKTFEITIGQPAVVRVRAENKSEARRKWWEALARHNETSETYLSELLQVKAVRQNDKK